MGRSTSPEPTPLFRDVDRDDRQRLITMMDATDAWGAVRSARSWVLDQASEPRRVAIDVGCGPGTFGAMARQRGWATVDVDRSQAMVDEVTRRDGSAPVAVADLIRLPFPAGGSGLVHCERALQWTADPGTALRELWRAVGADGMLAITDTDWATLEVDGLDDVAAARLGRAALAWVPHPQLAPEIAERLSALGATAVEVRTDTVTLDRWNPDDVACVDGPPGLPLRTIAAAWPDGDLSTIGADLDGLADRSRGGRFRASLTLVTTVARR